MLSAWTIRYLPSDSDKESNLWLLFNEEVTSSLGLSSGFDELGISLVVFVEISLGVGGGDLSGFSSCLLGIGSSLDDSLSESLDSLLSLDNVFWDNSGSKR